ncbi:unnamed protein product [Trichogramma brassicae]|uniref:Uncharacterized protein n=1 Tax=Trichogramma brassicae TaxID=86971 RepID=A0A6H5HT90_9HYME|nr:unnamed protein product [Trichogramma brassicae]
MPRYRRCAHATEKRLTVTDICRANLEFHWVEISCIAPPYNPVSPCRIRRGLALSDLDLIADDGSGVRNFLVKCNEEAMNRWQEAWDSSDKGKEQQGFGKGDPKPCRISIAPEHLRSRWLAARGTVNFPDVLADRVRCGDQRAAHASPLYRHRESMLHLYVAQPLQSRSNVHLCKKHRCYTRESYSSEKGGRALRYVRACPRHLIKNRSYILYVYARRASGIERKASPLLGNDIIPLLNYYVLSRDSINPQMFNEKYIRTRKSGSEPAMLSSASSYTYVFGIVYVVGARAGNLGSFDRVPHTIVARVVVLAKVLAAAHV